MKYVTYPWELSQDERIGIFDYARKCMQECGADGAALLITFGAGEPLRVRVYIGERKSDDTEAWHVLIE